MLNNSQVEYDTIIPNNVSLSSDKKVLKALERWHPGYIDWWKDLGPVGFQDMLVYLRTAINVDKDGWATFDYVKMPEYRWGILLAPQKEGRTIPFGDHKGEPVWQEVPGEYRSMLRRLIVIQGDTEPASIEQQRFLGSTAPSLYDMRNLFQVNVEEGRHLWAMVYLLQKYFGSDGREEANELLKRQSGSEDAPRMLGAFNESTPDWLSFFMFTTFTDRDGKMQLEALAQSGFDPLSRTCRFMLTEEAHHMFVGENGVRRVIKKTCEMMNKAGISDPYDIDKIRELGVIDLPTIQKKINLHYSLSLDLFGSENKIKNHFSLINKIFPITTFLQINASSLLPVQESVLQLGVDINQFSVSKRLKLESIVFVGSLIERKQVHEFIHLAHTYPQLYFNLIGDGEERESLKKKSPKNIIFHGLLSHSEIDEIFNCSDLMFLPSRSEGFPKVILEAASAGIPSILYDSYGASDWIQHYKDGFIVNDFQEAKDIVDKLISRPKILEKVSKNTFKLAARFDWKVVIKDWEKVIEDLFNEK